MRHELFHVCMLLALLAACERPEVGARAASADTIAVDGQRCILPNGTAPSDSAAVRCAELYVARNGYTDLPPRAQSLELHKADEPPPEALRPHGRSAFQRTQPVLSDGE